ncbi:MAG: type IV pilus assembly protein PilE [Halothiobacillaceae bacterium]|nr:MAG: type IV pilus assembly protein PilE [Halothiobacillaceae bacterium]
MKSAGIEKNSGFSLIELLVTLTVMAILTSFAYTSYESAITKNRRIEGKIALVDLQQRMERHFATYHNYSSATIGNGVNALLSTPLSEHGWYAVSIAQQTASSYLLHATPQGVHAAADEQCGTLTLSHLGLRGIAGGGNGNGCW